MSTTTLGKKNNYDESSGRTYLSSKTSTSRWHQSASAWMRKRDVKSITDAATGKGAL